MASNTLVAFPVGEVELKFFLSSWRAINSHNDPSRRIVALSIKASTSLDNVQMHLSSVRHGVGDLINCIMSKSRFNTKKITWSVLSLQSGFPYALDKQNTCQRKSRTPSTHIIVRNDGCCSDMLLCLLFICNVKP